MKKRFALILGGPHAGATRLYGRLRLHPQILGCRVMEPNFFSDERKWALGVDWYRSLWDFREPDERIAIEASGDYARHPLVPCPASRVAETPAGFRFVYLLRDPVERVAAWHAARLAEGVTEPARELRDLETELVGSRYASQLEAWRTHFPAEDFLLVASEEWSESPATVLDRICRFLELDDGFAFPDASPSALGHRPTRARALGWWLGRLGGGPLAASAPAAAGLPEALRATLEQELAPERERLAREWGFDPPLWRPRRGR